MPITKLQADQLNVTAGGGFAANVWEEDEHFSRTGLVSNFDFSIANTGTGSGGSSQTSESDHMGIWGISTGTTSSGFANLNHVRSTSWFEFADGAIDLYMIIKTPAALSDATDSYVVRAGVNQGTNSDSNNGVFFRYEHGVNSGNWQCIMRAGGSTVATINTSTAFAANTWVRLKITVDASQNIEAFIDEVSVGTATPSSTIAAGQFMNRCFQIVKVAGTNSRTFAIDRYYLKQTITF
jgi:hypothetical protein